MNSQVNEQFLINEARSVLLLLDESKIDAASERIRAVDAMLEKEKGSPSMDPDVMALWQQVGIAASNLDRGTYLEDVKDELNRVTFNWSRPTDTRQ